ncbi:cytochrome b [Martelella alba]|uniref:Cytochrome b n=1 Tax=Martelella alba TaxID=2590451 RepID=A0A506UDW7_9HYPH|nr:cytochrome b/b6 domain-containing protein [Martelella alba]TPW31144.1 cytochrome b [Martelella alba]
MVSATPLSFSVSQRILHWVMMLLIFFNLIFSDGMEHWSRLIYKGQTPTPDEISSANIHAYVGIAILVLALLRLALRLTEGVPAEPAEEPPVLQLASRIAHWTFYILFFLMPISGILAYYGGVDIAGEVHGGPLKVLLWALIVAHVAAVVVHQYWWKTDVLKRMTRG